MKNPLEPRLGPPFARFLIWVEAGTLWRPVVAGACSWFVGWGLLIFALGAKRSPVLLVVWLTSSVLWGTVTGLIVLNKRRGNARKSQ